MVPRLNPLLRMILTHPNFGMGPKRTSSAAGGGGTCVLPSYGFESAGFPIELGARCFSDGTFARGIIETMNIVHDVTVISYRPRTIVDDLVLSSSGGYLADFQRAQTDAMLLADAAAWRFDFLKPTSDTLGLSDAASSVWNFNKTLEEAMVLNSTVVNNTTYLRTISQVLALTDNARLAVIFETILDILLLDHQSTLLHDFVVNVAQNLGLSSSSTEDVIFVRALDTVLNASQTAAVTADYVRAIEDILLLADDAERFNALIQAAASTLALTADVLTVWDFNRPGTHDVGISDSASDGYVAVCDQLVYSDIGYDYPSDPQYGFETAGFAIPLGSHNSSNINYWVKYQQCWATNLETSEPPTPTYGGAGPTALAATGKWRGGVLSQAGYVYFVPYSNLYVYKFDPSTNTGANLTTSHTGSNKWAGGALSASGNIVCAPNDDTSILHINTANDAETTFGTFTGTTKWMGAYINKNGWVICAPRTSSQILAINPDSTANDVYLSTGPTSPALACGQLGPDGVTLYVCPGSSTAVLKCNTSNHQNITWSWLSGNYSGLNKWFGMVLEPSGNIYCVPYNSTTVLKIETANNDYQSTFGTLTGNAKWVCGALSHDTRVYTAFWNATNALCIRTGNDSTFTFNTFNGGSAETCGVVAIPDGRLIVVPNDISAIPHYIPDAGTSREADFLLSAYWNKL